MTLLTEELRARIGETATYTAPEPIGVAAGRYFALAIGSVNPVYAQAVSTLGPIVPPTWLFETNTYAGLPIDADGYAGHSWHLDVPGTRLVRGGHRYRWQRDVLPSDVVTAVWSLRDMTERATRSGSPMLVVTSECIFTDADGTPICSQVEDLIFVGLS